MLTHADLDTRFREYLELTLDGHWMWLGSTVQSGTGLMNVGDTGLSPSVHRLAYELWVGIIPKGYVVKQTCELKLCCNPDHLYVRLRKGLSTTSTLTFDDRLARAMRGSSSMLCALNEEQVKAIRQEVKYCSAESLAKKYHVVPATISNIARRKTWKNIPEEV